MRQCMTIFLAAAFLLGWFSQRTKAASPAESQNDDSGRGAFHDAGLYRPEEEFFCREKLEMDITSTGGGGPDIRALIAGDVEFSFTTGDNVILAHQEGKRLLMVMSGLNKVFINWAMHKETAKAKGNHGSDAFAGEDQGAEGTNRWRHESAAP